MTLFDINSNINSNKLELAANQLSTAVDTLKKKANKESLQDAKIVAQFEALKKSAGNLHTKVDKLIKHDVKVESTLKKIDATLTEIDAVKKLADKTEKISEWTVVDEKGDTYSASDSDSPSPKKQKGAVVQSEPDVKHAHAEEEVKSKYAQAQPHASAAAGAPAVVPQASAAAPTSAPRKKEEARPKWGPSKSEIENATPDLLLKWVITGVSIEVLREKLESLIKEYKNSEPKDPGQGRVLHELCDRLAAALLKKGKADEAFSIRDLAASLLQFTEDHPLFNMTERIRKEAAAQSDPRFGANFSGLDSGVLKGQHVCAYARTEGAKPVNLFHFNISHPARAELEETLKAIQDKRYLIYQNGIMQGVDYRVVPYKFWAVDPNNKYTGKSSTPWEAQAIEITFEGLGKVAIGNANRSRGVQVYHCLKNEITIEVDAGLKAGEALKRMQQMVSLLGLGPLFQSTKEEDHERLVLAQLFRKFYPKEAFAIEQTSWFYEMPPAVLRSYIAQQVENVEVDPARKKEFLHKLENYKNIKMEETFPGRKEVSIDIATALRDKKFWGLMHKISGRDANARIDALLCIVKKGLVSSQGRYQAGLFIDGMSSEMDLRSGGGNYVFTRLVNDRFNNENTDFLEENIEILIDLNATNLPSFGYRTDKYGTRADPDYAARDNLVDLFTPGLPTRENEVMIKDRIPPKFFKGFLVHSQAVKEQLLKRFQADGWAVKTEKGVDYLEANGLRISVQVAQDNRGNDFYPKKYVSDMWK